MKRKLAYERHHTGTLAGDRMQRVAQRAVQATNTLKEETESLDGRAASLEGTATDHETRLDSLELVGWGPFGRVGMTQKAMADANQTLTVAEGNKWFVEATGVLTAGRNLNWDASVLPANNIDQLFVRIVRNSTGGGFAVTVFIFGVGVGVAVPAGATRVLGFSNGGVFQVI